MGSKRHQYKISNKGTRSKAGRTSRHRAKAARQQEGQEAARRRPKQRKGRE